MIARHLEALRALQASVRGAAATDAVCSAATLGAFVEAHLADFDDGTLDGLQIELKVAHDAVGGEMVRREAQRDQMETAIARVARIIRTATDDMSADERQHLALILAGAAKLVEGPR